MKRGGEAFHFGNFELFEVYSASAPRPHILGAVYSGEGKFIV